MNWWVFSAFLLMGGIGYTTGLQHGSDQAELAAARALTTIEVPVAYPLADTCSIMLEAAWAVEESTPPPSE